MHSITPILLMIFFATNSWARESDPICLRFTPDQSLSQLTANVSHDELLQRLIFAEALASGCIDRNTPLAREDLRTLVIGIARVIENRITAGDRNSALKRRFGDGARGVVFKRAQFNSSLASYRCARRDEFLCPTHSSHFADLWPWVKQSQKDARSGDTQFSGRRPEQVYNYYLFRHFEGCAVSYDPPEWTRTTRRHIEGRETTDALNACIGFYSP